MTSIPELFEEIRTQNALLRNQENLIQDIRFRIQNLEGFFREGANHQEKPSVSDFIRESLEYTGDETTLLAWTELIKAFDEKQGNGLSRQRLRLDLASYGLKYQEFISKDRGVLRGYKGWTLA